MSSDAYYLPTPGAREGYERFLSTDRTPSVWSPNMQHGAPPSALLARAVERCAPREGTRIAQLTVHLLGPVPVAEVEVRAEVLRPGRRIEMLGAELTAAGPDGLPRTVARATAWRIAQSDTAHAVHDAEQRLRPGPSDDPGEWVFPPSWRSGYLESLRFGGTSGPPPGGGPGWAWAQPMVPLVSGESNTPLTTVMSVADIANGVGARLDPEQFTFLNTELTVHLSREPAGDWVGVVSEATIGADGIGMCAGVLHDEHGPVGRSAQILEIRER